MAGSTPVRTETVAFNMSKRHMRQKKESEWGMEAFISITRIFLLLKEEKHHLKIRRFFAEPVTLLKETDLIRQ